MKQLEEYLSYLKEQKNYSENTIDSYKRDIEMLFEIFPLKKSNNKVLFEGFVLASVI